jgi:NAD(P)-dependent dehydrogenase (short-subunit alcohol dehydrogenase family)
MSALHRIPQPLGKLEGKAVVITGGTTGIGLAAAKLFVTVGAYVFITGRRQQELESGLEKGQVNYSSRARRATGYQLYAEGHASFSVKKY